MNADIIKTLKFKGIWRTYQARVLHELENYLNDKKLNVVAAPGAGKTTLGVEVIKMLGNNVLILSPTITIRNQWKYRICNDFVENNEYAEQISFDAKDVKPITILTYQLIHSIMSDKKQAESFVKKLLDTKIKTVVLDEAHHLRTEWYHSLINLIEIMEKHNIVTVALTGTPPYDVSPAEWSNYNTLCGSVDAEISIPELVKSGDLAPHQDLLWFSKLELDEETLIEEQYKNRNSFMKYLHNNSEFLYAIKASPFLNDLDKNINLIYENIPFTISLISYLIDNDDMDIDAGVLLNFLSLTKENIPCFNTEQAEILINGLLGVFEEYFKNLPAIKAKLKELDLLESTKRVNFNSSLTSKKIFAKSKSKLKSIVSITQIEYSSLKKDLREVILVDYIGQNNKSGVTVLSVFDSLKNKNYKTGILSGTLIVIPESSKDTLYKIIEEHNIPKENVLTAKFEDNYLRVESYGNISLVAIITELFYRGEINVLVGTQALLGEGWDSPCVNSLILGSNVGSFMLSNQMRGRAIRIDKNNLNKVSDIWHLVCLSNYLTSSDLETVERRFNTFEGISFVDNTIQNGIDRLGYGSISYSNCMHLNKQAEKMAAEKNNLPAKWAQVFKGSVITEKNFVSKIYEVAKTEKIKLPVFMVKHEKNFFVKNVFLPIFLHNKTKEFKNKYSFILMALLKVMCDATIIKTPFKNIKLDCVIAKDYTPFITITNCTNLDRKIFIDTVQELFSPAKDQRYILKNKNKYIVVPDIVGSKKQQVKSFEKILRKNFGNFEIIFTRSIEGRKELLLARYNPMFDNIIKTSRIWI